MIIAGKSFSASTINVTSIVNNFFILQVELGQLFGGLKTP